MTHVIELTDDERAALVEFLIKHGVQPGYVSEYQPDPSPLERVLGKLDKR